MVMIRRSTEMEPTNLIGPAYMSRSMTFDSSRCINLYPELSESGESKDVAMLVGCPGTVRATTLINPASNNSGIRGVLQFSKDVLVVVTRSTVWIVNSTLSAVTAIACGVEIQAGTDPVSMASNGTMVMIVTGTPFGYFLDIGLATSGSSAIAVTQIVDPDFFGADKVVYIGGYFVFNKLGTQQFQITAINGTTIDPLDFASSSALPDLLISIADNQGELWLFGEYSTEVWFNSGNSDFPFEPIQGAFSHDGIAAKNSVSRTRSGACWLQKNDKGQGMVVKATGFQAQRISTYAIEYQINQYARIDDAIGMSYEMEGHSFYLLTFPTANATWCYDESTNLWHERMWRDPLDNSHNRHRAQCMTAFAGKVIVGDHSRPDLYYFDLNRFVDNYPSILPPPSPMVAIRQWLHKLPPGSNQLIKYSKLWVDVEVGVGNPGDGLVDVDFFNPGRSDPEITLDWSNDGGHSFRVDSVRSASMGKIGEFATRVNFRRLGRARAGLRVFRLTIIDAAKRILIGAGVDYK